MGCKMEIDLSRLPAATRQKMDEIFRSDFDLKVLKAVERQTRTAKAREHGARWRDDLMPQFEIDPFVDSIWRQYYGHNYTEDAQLMKFLKARNPEIFITARSGKIQTGYTGENRKQKAESRNRHGCRFDRNTLTLAK